MSTLLAILGVLLMLFSFFAFGMNPPPAWAAPVFFIGVVLTIVGAIIANRNRQNQASQ